MKTIYALNSGHDFKISSCRFFATIELAEEALKQIKKDRKFQPGVDVIVDTKEEFSFLFGWEEAKVTFKIVPVQLIDEKTDLTY
jgi:hypothetical protein